jgi:hypothetical protein
LTVEFGPSRSKRFAQAVAEAKSGSGESELEPGRYRVRFLLDREARVYTSLARLLQRVRDWRASEVYEGDQLVSSYHARDIEVSECPKALKQPRELCEESKSAPRRFGCARRPRHGPGSRLGGVLERERREGVLDFKTRFSNARCMVSAPWPALVSPFLALPSLSARGSRR